MDGLQVQWLLDPTAIDMPRTLRFVIDAFVDRLTGEPGHDVNPSH